MCGGGKAPNPPQKDPPPPTPPPELILDDAGSKSKNLRSKIRKSRAGRSALVTPGLSIGSAIGAGVGNAAGGLGIARA